jgi:hypothetical protein
MRDPQLAITVARVYEGSDSGPVLRNLLETKILPSAISEGNRWLAAWALWILKRKDTAVRALLSPLDALLPSYNTNPASPSPNNRLFLLNDPALIIFYKHIRERTTTTLRGAHEITPAMEWDFVIDTARVYDRMGCDLLALDLVKNWQFLQVERKRGRRKGKDDEHARHLLHRRNSLVIADDPTPHQEGEGEEVKVDEKWKEGLVKPPAAVFEEPDMSWAF